MSVRLYARAKTRSAKSYRRQQTQESAQNRQYQQFRHKSTH